MKKLTLNNQTFTFNCDSEIITMDYGKSFTTHNPTDNGEKGMGEMVLCKLTYMLVNGMQKCYNDIGEYMLDLTMDLPWNEKGSKIAIEHIKSHKAYPTVLAEFEKQYPNCGMFE